MYANVNVYKAECGYERYKKHMYVLLRKNIMI